MFKKISVLTLLLTAACASSDTPDFLTPGYGSATGASKPNIISGLATNSNDPLLLEYYDNVAYIDFRKDPNLVRHAQNILDAKAEYDACATDSCRAEAETSVFLAINRLNSLIAYINYDYSDIDDIDGAIDYAKKIITTLQVKTQVNSNSFVDKGRYFTTEFSMPNETWANYGSSSDDFFILQPNDADEANISDPLYATRKATNVKTTIAMGGAKAGLQYSDFGYWLTTADTRDQIGTDAPIIQKNNIIDGNNYYMGDNSKRVDLLYTKTTFSGNVIAAAMNQITADDGGQKLYMTTLSGSMVLSATQDSRLDMNLNFDNWYNIALRQDETNCSSYNACSISADSIKITGANGLGSQFELFTGQGDNIVDEVSSDGTTYTTFAGGDYNVYGEGVPTEAAGTMWLGQKADGTKNYEFALMGAFGGKRVR